MHAAWPDLKINGDWPHLVKRADPPTSRVHAGCGSCSAGVSKGQFQIVCLKLIINLPEKL